MSGIRDRLRENRVRALPAETSLLGKVWFREPSGADWIRIRQLFTAVAQGGSKQVHLYLVVPLLLCEESGDLVFPDYEKGVAEMQALRAEALAEITSACMDVTGVGKLLSRGVEGAEKNSLASPISDSLSASPAI